MIMKWEVKTMLRNMSIPLFVLLMIIIAFSADAQLQSPEKGAVTIVGLDSTAFPVLKLNLFIDGSCSSTGDIEQENLKVEEEGNSLAIGDYYFTGNATGQEIDLAVVFDNTTSMDEEIRALKSKVQELTQKISSSNLDARYSLVTFNCRVITTETTWTSDANSFKDAIGNLSASGGDFNLPENSLGGIERALSFGFRPEAQKIIIVITDELSYQKGDGKSNSSYDLSDVKEDLSNSGATFIAVSPDFSDPNADPDVPRSDVARYADMKTLATQSSGLWIDLRSADFSVILDQFQGIITESYVIECISPDPTPSENRTIQVSVNIPGCVDGSDSVTYTTPDSARWWIQKGNALFYMEKYLEAIQSYDRAIQLDPNYADAWNNKGVSLNILGRYEEALNATNEAINLDPQYPDAWNNRGVSLNNMGQYEEALNATNKAIEFNPQYSEAWNNKGASLNSIGRYEEALYAVNKSIELDPQYPDSWSNKGASLNNLGRYEEALNVIDKAIELNENMSEAWNNRCVSLNSLGRYEEALEAAERAIELNENLSAAWNNKAASLNNLGRYEEALEAAERAIKINGNLSEAWNAKSIALRAIGRANEADDALAMAKKLGFVV
jgi:tetratricopeptide (TPR) repeat protein